MNPGGWYAELKALRIFRLKSKSIESKTRLTCVNSGIYFRQAPEHYLFIFTQLTARDDFKKIIGEKVEYKIFFALCAKL